MTIHKVSALDTDGREEDMLDNSSRMDARIATQMGMTEALKKDGAQREAGSGYYDKRHGQAVTTRSGLFKRLILHLLG
jgi:hypothetical protein